MMHVGIWLLETDKTVPLQLIQKGGGELKDATKGKVSSAKLCHH